MMFIETIKIIFLFTFYQLCNAYLTKDGRRLLFNVPVRVFAADLTEDAIQLSLNPTWKLKEELISIQILNCQSV